MCAKKMYILATVFAGGGHYLTGFTGLYPDYGEEWAVNYVREFFGVL